MHRSNQRLRILINALWNWEIFEHISWKNEHEGRSDVMFISRSGWKAMFSSAEKKVQQHKPQSLRNYYIILLQ